MIGRIDSKALSRSAAFDNEFHNFVARRATVRRFMPTPDTFPLFCELVSEAKKHYLVVSASEGFTRRIVSFAHFGRDWAIRVNLLASSTRKPELFIDLCSNDSKTVLVTVAVECDGGFIGKRSS